MAPASDRPNVIVCGYNSVTSPVIRILRKCEKYLNVVGYWSENTCSNSYGLSTISDLRGLKLLSCNIDELVCTDDFEVIFLCSPPFIQLQIVQQLVSGNRLSFRSNKQCSPLIILVPPIICNFDIETLRDPSNQIFMAMPLRKLSSFNILHSHLYSNSKSNTLKTSSTQTKLPNYWRLGDVESINLRLQTVNHIQTNNYNWMCEPKSMGGGLSNLYGSGLMDLAYLLTGGMKISSITCLTRTFDTELSSRSHSIRRISSDDYIVLLGELELDPNQEHYLFEGRRPVIMICLSSEIPYPITEFSLDPNVPEENQFFKLNIELIGSEGSFYLTDCGKQIKWIPRRCITSRLKRLKDPVVNSSLNRSEDNNLNGHLEQLSEVDEDGLNEEVNGYAQNQSTPKSSVTVNGIGEMNGSASYRIEKVGKTMEIAHLVSKAPADDAWDFGDQTQCWMPQPVREAWRIWFNQLGSNLINKTPTPTFEALVATPEHWAYIQRVMTAIDKAARLRCWIDVATGERL